MFKDCDDINGTSPQRINMLLLRLDGIFFRADLTASAVPDGFFCNALFILFSFINLVSSSGGLLNTQIISFDFIFLAAL